MVLPDHQCDVGRGRSAGRAREGCAAAPYWRSTDRSRRDGGSSVTGDDGKARIPLAKQTKENSWVSLQILKSPPGRDLVMVSPWDYRSGVPSFENESENFVEVVLVQRGDRAALESGTVLASLAAQL